MGALQEKGNLGRGKDTQGFKNDGCTLGIKSEPDIGNSENQQEAVEGLQEEKSIVVYELVQQVNHAKSQVSINLNIQPGLMKNHGVT